MSFSTTSAKRVDSQKDLYILRTKESKIERGRYSKILIEIETFSLYILIIIDIEKEKDREKKKFIAERERGTDIYIQ